MIMPRRCGTGNRLALPPGDRGPVRTSSSPYREVGALGRIQRHRAGSRIMANHSRIPRDQHAHDQEHPAPALPKASAGQQRRGQCHAQPGRECSSIPWPARAGAPGHQPRIRPTAAGKQSAPRQPAHRMTMNCQNCDEPGASCITDHTTEPPASRPGGPALRDEASGNWHQA